MSRAYQCDRCGNLFAERPDNRELRLNREPDGLFNVDLCPGCYDALRAWYEDPTASFMEVESDV